MPLLSPLKTSHVQHERDIFFPSSLIICYYFHINFRVVFCLYLQNLDWKCIKSVCQFGAFQHHFCVVSSNQWIKYISLRWPKVKVIVSLPFKKVHVLLDLLIIFSSFNFLSIQTWFYIFFFWGGTWCYILHFSFHVLIGNL